MVLVAKAGATKLFELFHNEHPELFVLQIHPGLVGGTDMHSKFAHTTGGFEFDDGESLFYICKSLSRSFNRPKLFLLLYFTPGLALNS